VPSPGNWTRGAGLSTIRCHPNGVANCPATLWKFTCNCSAHLCGDVESIAAGSNVVGCESGHGGSEYERLNSDGRLISQLHNWEVSTSTAVSAIQSCVPMGNGVLLWFELEDYELFYRAAGWRQ